MYKDVFKKEGSCSMIAIGTIIRTVLEIYKMHLFTDKRSLGLQSTGHQNNTKEGKKKKTWRRTAEVEFQELNLC